MTYHYAVRRGALLLDRTLTHARAKSIAARYAGAVVVAALFISGCAGPNQHAAKAVPCDNDNCGKNTNGGK